MATEAQRARRKNITLGTLCLYGKKHLLTRTYITNPIQTDMKIFATLFLALQLSSAAAVSLPAYSTHYDPQRDAFADGRDAIQLAASTNRKVLIEVGGDWCKWCHILDQFLQDNPDVQQQLHQTFVMLKINVSDVNDNAEFLKAFPKPLGYPHMYITDNSGKILWSQDTADFLQQGKYSRQRMQAFITKWKKHEEQ